MSISSSFSQGSNYPAKWQPRTAPLIQGGFDVGVILIEFQDTEIQTSLSEFKNNLNNAAGTNYESASIDNREKIAALDQEQYFKLYTNGITWPVLHLYPESQKEDIYKAPEIMGYYCHYDFWYNPAGYGNDEDGNKRVAKLKADALAWAKRKSKSFKNKVITHYYISSRIKDADRLPDIDKYYSEGHRNAAQEDDGGNRVKRKTQPRKSKSSDKKESPGSDFNPWDYYGPNVRWGEPMWSNSSVQILDGQGLGKAGGTMAHELGHVLGAPDLYRVGPYNDGISGAAALMTYGPTASAFSRFYHHGFLKEENYPLINQPGTYTLNPRHIKPEGTEKLGYIVPSRHPHYYYQLEYIYNENGSVGTGNKEGMLISVINLNVSSYQGSPDLQYVYRPDDPYFRGQGTTNECLFGKAHNRTEFNEKTTPACILPNLLDGGIRVSNIQENGGTLTFDLALDKTPLSSSDYKLSLLPQVKLHEVVQIQPYSFLMECNIKFRGEPLKAAYGFCWSKRSKPTISDNHIVLTHSELYQGRALNLEPESTYYVRAWVANSLGVRYSDEELSVKTLKKDAEPSDIGPLLLDGFSDSWELYRRFGKKTYANFRSYTSVSALGKLIAYYSPPKFGSTLHTTPSPLNTLGKKSQPSGKGKTEPLDFDRLNWNPNGSQPLSKYSETFALFGQCYSLSEQCKMFDYEISKDFLKNLIRAFKLKGKPELLIVTGDNKEKAFNLIKNELCHSRPVLFAQVPDLAAATRPIEWGIIDGLKDGRLLHFHLGSGSTIYEGKREGFLPMDEITIDGGYTLHLIAPFEL